MAAFIMSGRLQAILFTLSLTLMSFLIAPLGVLSNAAVALVTLRLGAIQGLQVALPATLGLTLVIAVLQGNFWVGLLSGLMSWLPVIVLGAVLERTVSWMQVFHYLLIILVSFIVLFYLIVGDPAVLWEEWLTKIVALLQITDTEQQTAILGALHQAAPYMTGLIAALVGIQWIVSLMIGRYWQAQLFNPGGFQQELHTIRISKPLALVMMVMVALTLLTPNALVTNIVLTGIAVFLFAGLSLAHYCVKAFKLSFVWLITLYFMLLLMPFYSGVLLAAFGIIDSQADFRRYIKRSA